MGFGNPPATIVLRFFSVIYVSLRWSAWIKNTGVQFGFCSWCCFAGGERVALLLLGWYFFFIRCPIFSYCHSHLSLWSWWTFWTFWILQLNRHYMRWACDWCAACSPNITYSLSKQYLFLREPQKKMSQKLDKVNNSKCELLSDDVGGSGLSNSPPIQMAEIWP